MSKVLQPYTDWMIKTRGKIEPRIGDKIFNSNRLYIIIDIDYNNDEVIIENKYGYKINTYSTSKNNYVEIELPEIEWKDDAEELYSSGRINNFELFTIDWFRTMPNKYRLWTNNIEYEEPIFIGTTFEECKQKAEELLWKSTK